MAHLPDWQRRILAGENISKEATQSLFFVKMLVPGFEPGSAG